MNAKLNQPVIMLVFFFVFDVDITLESIITMFSFFYVRPLVQVPVLSIKEVHILEEIYSNVINLFCELLSHAPITDCDNKHSCHPTEYIVLLLFEQFIDYLPVSLLVRSP